MIGGGERFFLIVRLVLFVAYLGLLYASGVMFGLIGIAVAGLFFSLASNFAAARWIAGVWGIDNMATAFFRPFLFGGAPRNGSAKDGAFKNQAALRARLEPAE